MNLFENKTYSQNGEDGIIAHIFDKIGTTNRIAVEFGVSAGGGGGQTNTRLLAEKGWKVFWFDCDASSVVPKNCAFMQVKLTSENICSTFEKAGIPKNFDLLSIDVDGNDYHLREALCEYSPNVCVMEYNGSFEKHVEYIMPEDDNYEWKNKDLAFGASLLSYTKQAERLGYDLVYCEKSGANAFFIKSDINLFPKKTCEEAWIPLYWAWKKKK